jgi:hypothetical protein
MVTSIGVARYSRQTDATLRKVGGYFATSHSVEHPVTDVVKGSPVALGLSKWSGLANCFASAITIVSWVLVGFFAPSTATH